MISVKTTKSLKAYAKKGVDSRSIHPIHDAVMNCSEIPVEHKLPFILSVANCFMNGGVPAGYRSNDCKVYFYNVSDGKEYFLSQPEMVLESYTKTNLSTLIRWSDAIELVNNL